MKIIEVKTIDQLKELYDSSAMTWEGLAEECFEEALECCCADGKDGIGYLTSGEVMNKLCHLTGTNSYANNINIFSIKNFKGLAMSVGARWMDDVICNNAYRENMSIKKLFKNCR